MCGRYAASKDQAALVEEFEAIPVSDPLPADFNVAPTKSINAVLVRNREEGPRRELMVVRWGLVPSWAKDPSIGSRMINARMETLAEKPAFRAALAKRRCLLPADGFYEWYTPEQGPEQARGGKPKKQPFFIHPADGSTLAMAGLFEFWHDANRPREDPASWLTTATVITTAAADAVGRIHDRMPLVVPRAKWAEWLDPTFGRGPDEVRQLLVPANEVALDSYPVSTDVNNVRNNGPHLVDPVPLEPEPEPEPDLNQEPELALELELD